MRANEIDITDIFLPPNKKPSTVLYFRFTTLKYKIIPIITPKLIPNKQYSATLKYKGDTGVVFLIFALFYLK